MTEDVEKRTQEKELVPEIVSLEKAQQRIGRAGIADVSVLDAICDRLEAENLTGSASDYHNVAVEMARLGCYPQAFRVVERGLKPYPYNVDLLADAVYYGSSAGKWDKCEEYAEKLNHRSKGLWNWRAFTFLIDYYYKDRIDWLESEDDVLASMKTALEISRQAQQVLAQEERGYLAESRIHEAIAKWYEATAERIQTAATNQTAAVAQMNPKKCREYAKEERQKAMSTLEKALSNNSTMTAVLCCLRYADLQFEACNYKKTIEVCDQAFGYGESQPSAKMGYFSYLAAMSMDCLIHREKAFKEADRVRECYRRYNAALALLEPDRSAYRDNIRLRVMNLQILTGIQYEDSV